MILFALCSIRSLLKVKIVGLILINSHPSFLNNWPYKVNFTDILFDDLTMRKVFIKYDG